MAVTRRRVKVNDEFGTLTVIGEAERSASRKRKVLVRCKCGLEKPVLEHNLINGNTESCGKSECSTRSDSLRKLYGYLKPGDQARNYIYLNYQSVARQKHRAWEIDFETFCELTSKPCRYCGAPPNNRVRDRNGPGVFVYSGIDRVNPQGGYTEDNVVPACFICNHAKKNLTLDEFREWALRLAANMERR